ncbi:MAG: hypothetical protein PHW53_01720 [Patescibacteria group bacterium]|nr:hypothetical protein [Patescibacteria group bacterium]
MSSIIMAPGLIQIVPVLPAPEPAGTPITREGVAVIRQSIVLRRAAKCDLLQAATPQAVSAAIRRMGAASEVIRTFEQIPAAKADYAKASIAVVRARSASEILAAIETAKRASERQRAAEALLRKHGCIL